MAVIKTTTQDSEEFVVTLKSPYTNISSINGIESIDTEGETETVYYEKDFSVSQDGILYSDYKELSDKNMKRLKIDSTKPLYFRYKFTQVGDGELSFNSITLNTTPVDSSVPQTIPACVLMDNNSGCCASPQIVYNNCCGDSSVTFNPYAIGNAATIYNQLSTLVSNIFGFCVDYFKVSPNERSRDVILKEYSLLNVVDNKQIKILVPDNALPTRELQYNTLMIDYPKLFEVHIVKSEFEQVFGEGARPEVGDYLYFQQYVNQMYQINAVSFPDDFMYSAAYWRVSLVMYQQKKSIKFATDDLRESTEELIFSEEDKFKEERLYEFEDVRKDNQLNDIADKNTKDVFANAADSIRQVLNEELLIRQENIYNASTVLSKYYYAMDSIKNGELGVQYRYKSGFNSNDERMISLFFRPRNITVSDNILIDQITKDENGKTVIWLESSMRGIKIGQYARISRTCSYNGFHKIIGFSKKDNTITLKTDYIDDVLKDGARVSIQSSNVLFTMENESGVVFQLVQTYNQFILEVNNKDYFYYLGTDTEFEEDKWYAFIFGFHSGNTNMWLYSIDEDATSKEGFPSSKLLNARLTPFSLGTSNKMTNEISFLFDSVNYSLYGTDADITNIRIWNKLCEKDLHDMILSQYVVDDTHNCDLVDNAQPELLMNSKYD